MRASRFSCTLVFGLWRGNLGSRALMESARASPHLPDGLEWAQRGLRLVACRSDLSCLTLGRHTQRRARPVNQQRAELEDVVDEDEEIAAVEVWEAIACPDCEGQIRMTAEHLEAQGWQSIREPF